MFCPPLPLKVVAPSLTPESYNKEEARRLVRNVVAPSLTPESYNFATRKHSQTIVVAPSLTPESYNTLAWRSSPTCVVAPSLTPESYNYLASNPALILTGAGLGAVFFTSKKQHLVSIDLFFLEIFRADQEPHVGELLFADLQAAY